MIRIHRLAPLINSREREEDEGNKPYEPSSATNIYLKRLSKDNTGSNRRHKKFSDSSKLIGNLNLNLNNIEIDKISEQDSHEDLHKSQTPRDRSIKINLMSKFEHSANKVTPERTEKITQDINNVEIIDFDDDEVPDLVERRFINNLSNLIVLRNKSSSKSMNSEDSLHSIDNSHIRINNKLNDKFKEERYKNEKTFIQNSISYRCMYVNKINQFMGIKIRNFKIIKFNQSSCRIDCRDKLAKAALMFRSVRIENVRIFSNICLVICNFYFICIVNTLK